MDGKMEEKNIKNNENIIDIIEEDNSQFYRDYLNCIITKGFKNWCEDNNSFWAFTDMAVIVMNNYLNREDFIVMIVESKNKKATIKLYMDYDNDEEEESKDKTIGFNNSCLLYTQKYDYTDLKEGKYKFYACYNELNTFTFMLPEEY